jgi:hypothetical protein
MSENIYNIISLKLPNYEIDGITVYNQDTSDESYYFLEYLTKNQKYINRVDLKYYYNNPSERYLLLLPIHFITYDKLPKLFNETHSKFTVILKNLLKSNNSRILLYDYHESGNPNEIDFFVKYIKSIGLSEKNLFIINNDYKIYDYKKFYNWKLNVFKINHLISYTSKKLLEYTPEFIYDKPKLFLCKNKASKIHRVSTASFLRSKFENDTNYSHLTVGKDLGIDGFEKTFLNTKYDWVIDAVKKTQTLGIKNTDYDVDKIKECKDYNNVFIDFAGELSPKDYENSYINITTESIFFEDNIHITEKSFKPFGFYQLPIFVASHHHVKTLKKLYNFDIFDDIINHEYDNESNPHKRLLMVYDEIERLFLNKNKIIEFYKNNRERLENNRKILKDISNSNMDKGLLKLINKSFNTEDEKVPTNSW